MFITETTPFIGRTLGPEGPQSAYNLSKAAYDLTDEELQELLQLPVIDRLCTRIERVPHKLGRTDYRAYFQADCTSYFTDNEELLLYVLKYVESKRFIASLSDCPTPEEMTKMTLPVSL